MRLTAEQIHVIREPILNFDPQAGILLFGSRTNDAARGGDIDILCLSDKIDRHQRRRIRRQISDRLDGQRVDLIVTADSSKPFVRMVLQDAVPLTTWPAPGR